MKKVKIIALTLAVVLSLCISASATEEVEVITEEAVLTEENFEITPFASPCIDSYGAWLTKGSAKGEVIVTHDISASMTSSKVKNLGVSNIIIYKSNGTVVRTIWGSTANGLMKVGSISHGGDYSVTLDSGVSYYAKVTLYVLSTDGVSDSRTVTTKTVTTR